jgi:pimeloyl-ACP methyl ester carboxylesterase/DNA-binding CsgD family transcriptional regulator
MMQYCARLANRGGCPMNQQIRFCKSFDGVRLAYATSGTGTPMVMSASWLTHLEHQWRSLAWKPWLEHFSGRHTLIRYDSRGAGLSDREVDEFSFELWIRDIEAVIDAAGYDKFCMLGTCQGGPIAIEYAARHPERVSQLVLYGTYARGLLMRPEIPLQAEKAQVLRDMLNLGWGLDSHAFMQVWATLFQPGGGIEHLRSWSEHQRCSTSAENAAGLYQTTFEIDVQESARRVRCPTLVINVEHDALVPLEEGRRLANLIRGARFATLDSINHMLLPEEPAWQQMVREVEVFLDETAPPPEVAAGARFSTLTSRERQVLDEIARGFDNTEIAACLELSEKTVRNHVTRVFDKIGVGHRYQAIVMARDAGFGRTSR